MNGNIIVNRTIKLSGNVRIANRTQGTGTDDYTQLNNLPSINGITIIGDLSFTDLGMNVFATKSELPTKTSELQNDSGFVVQSELPTKTSELTNDSGFITQNDIPTNVSSFVNDSQYQTQTQVNDLITDHNLNITAHPHIRQLITTETSNRESADNNLQSQIDAITSSSDVVDIVGTYADLQNYPTSTLNDNDIVKVLSDSTHDNTESYYRWNKSSSKWNYIGSEGSYYTKSEADSKFVPNTRQINGKALSSDVTLTYSDVGALSDSTTIPTKTSYLTNDSGYITTSALSGYATETWVQNYIASLNATTVRY